MDSKYDEGSREWFQRYCKNAEAEIGRGWKRRLAEKVGVRESNVQVWLKSGQVPAAVRRAIELADHVEELEIECSRLQHLIEARWIEEKNVCGQKIYSVHEMDLETGRSKMIAGDINNLEDAREIAGLPQAKKLILEVYDVLKDLFGTAPHPDDKNLLRRIENWPEISPMEEKSELQQLLKDNIEVNS